MTATVGSETILQVNKGDGSIEPQQGEIQVASPDALTEGEVLAYHVNPATRVPVFCRDPQDCPVGFKPQAHYVDATMAMMDIEAASAAELRDDDIPAEFDRALVAAAEGGFAKASEAYPTHIDSQLAILKHSVAVEFVAKKLCLASSDKMLHMYADVLAWVIRTESQETGEGKKKVYARLVDPHLRTRRAALRVQAALSIDAEPTLADLLNVAGMLWVNRNAPYHARTKALLFAQETSVDGYTPKDERVTQVFDNAPVAVRLNMDLNDLPEGVLGYDIETDTANGYGLRPFRSQITEVVLSARDKSWVFSGDERYILESLAAVLNEQPEGTILAGWNNHSFDNIALQTRAEFHGVENWNGSLVSTENYTGFSSVGPLEDPQSLSWMTSDGHVLDEVDVFQIKSMCDKMMGLRYTRGLKPFVESMGCSPVKVDRARLHELTEEERVDYVLSDGLATLRAYTGAQELLDNVDETAESDILAVM